MLAGDVMTREVISVASDASAMQAGTLMLYRNDLALPRGQGLTTLAVGIDALELTLCM